MFSRNDADEDVLSEFINYNPFYSPQEFSSFILVNVNIPLESMRERGATAAGWTNNWIYIQTLEHQRLFI